MKRLLAPLALAAATGLTAAAPAHAFTPGGPFTLTGPIAFKTAIGTIPCTAAFQANGIPGAGGTIVAATFSGSAICGALRPAGLPWTMTLTGPSTLSIANPAVTGPLSCGPGAIAAAWNNTPPGVMILVPTVLPVNCQVSSTGLSASPAQTLP